MATTAFCVPKKRGANYEVSDNQLRDVPSEWFKTNEMEDLHWIMVYYYRLKPLSHQRVTLQRVTPFGVTWCPLTSMLNH